MKIAIYCKNEVLQEDGKVPLWVVDAERVGTIKSLTARDLATETAKDGKPRKSGMWSSAVVDETPPREELQKLLNDAHRRGNQEAHEAHRVAQECGLPQSGVGEELTILREIVRLVDDARERIRQRPRGAGAPPMGDEIDDLICRLHEIRTQPPPTMEAAENG